MKTSPGRGSTLTSAIMQSVRCGATKQKQKRYVCFCHGNGASKDRTPSINRLTYNISKRSCHLVWPHEVKISPAFLRPCKTQPGNKEQEKKSQDRRRKRGQKLRRARASTARTKGAQTHMRWRVSSSTPSSDIFVLLIRVGEITTNKRNRQPETYTNRKKRRICAPQQQKMKNEK